MSNFGGVNFTRIKKLTIVSVPKAPTSAAQVSFHRRHRFGRSIPAQP
jgi:hypothetical protein